MLHVTNGESVSLAETGWAARCCAGEIRCTATASRRNLDADGDCPLVRARSCIDQAQLIEILSRLRGRQGVSLICTDRIWDR